MSSDANGNDGRPNGILRVTVTLDAHTQKLGIDVDCGTMDVALGMLERARLELDARFRFQRGRELLIEQVKADQLAGVARDVMAGRRIQG